MGNHTVGTAIGLAAEESTRNRRAGESAIDLLDRICNPYRNCDAEFESFDPEHPSCTHPDFGSFLDPHSKAALGMLMVEAFAPTGLAALPRYSAIFDCNADDATSEASSELWWAEVRTPFKARYDFW